jgi:hypothetical protein
MANWTMADGRRHVTVTLEAPEGFHTGEGVINVSLASLNASAIPNAQGQVQFSDFAMGPSGSDTITEKPLGVKGNVIAYGASNFEANVTVVRSMTDGEFDADDTLYPAIGEKGVISYWFTRTGRLATIPMAIGDNGWVYEIISDEPQEQPDEADYVKNPIQMGVRARRRYVISG